jgi:hypothetical protein
MDVHIHAYIRKSPLVIPPPSSVTNDLCFFFGGGGGGGVWVAMAMVGGEWAWE